MWRGEAVIIRLPTVIGLILQFFARLIRVYRCSEIQAASLVSI